MQDGNGSRLRHRRTAISVIGLVAAAVVLASCSSTPSSTGSLATDTFGAQPSAGQDGGGGGGGNVAVAAASVSIAPASSGKINPATPVVIKASNGTLTSVTVKNTVKDSVVTGDFSSDKSTWTSNEVLGFGSAYAVTAVGANSAGKSVTKQSTISTISPAHLAYANMIPAPTSVKTVGVGQPMVFAFKNNVVNKEAVQKAITITTTPSQPGAWYWVASNELHYRAKDYWQAGTTIKVDAKIYGLDMGGGTYGAEDRSVTMHVHDAMIAKADGNTKTLKIYDNGRLIKSMPTSLGKGSTPTHSGPHVISDRQKSVVMDSCSYGVCPPNPKAYKETEYWAERMSNDGEFVHENPATVGVQGSANVSHGCANLSEANAEWFYNHMGIGDVVDVTNSGGPKLPVWDRYGDWEVPWSTWEAGNA
jgi:lipoprotein-anchoring transpeptidase ErfK/SrfK